MDIGNGFSGLSGSVNWHPEILGVLGVKIGFCGFLASIFVSLQEPGTEAIQLLFLFLVICYQKKILGDLSILQTRIIKGAGVSLSRKHRSLTDLQS